MFKLHVVQAEFGDCMILEYGNQESNYILIDGGPPGSYDNYLKKTMHDIMGAHDTLEAVMITHVDNDHIKGVLDLLAELKRQKDNHENLSVKIKDLWLNTFSDTMDTNNNLSNSINSILSDATNNNASMATTEFALDGIKEGNKVTTFCNILGIPMNSPATQGIIRLGSPDATLSFGNLEFIIVGPTKENLDELKREWEEWLSDRQNEADAGNFNILSMSDKSIPNLSSIMFLVKGDGRSILFTGDGRGDHLIEGLKKKGLLQNGKMHVDVLKVAHHGSDRNTNRDFFERITADKYVISANGKYGNPDYATLTWIVESAKDSNRVIELVITNETPTTKKLLRDYDPQEWGYSIRYIPDGKLVLQV